MFWRFCTFFNIFYVRLGEKRKNVSFSRVYVCVKAKITFVSFFFLFIFLHLSLIHFQVLVQHWWWWWWFRSVQWDVFDQFYFDVDPPEKKLEVGKYLEMCLPPWKDHYLDPASSFASYFFILRSNRSSLLGAMLLAPFFSRLALNESSGLRI